MSLSTTLANKVFVVWPPVWSAFDIHVAVPALCGYLASRNIPVTQFDLNIDFFRYIVAENTLEKEATSAPTWPENIRAAISFARQYYHVERSRSSYPSAKIFSDDALRILLSKALTVFNYCNSDSGLTITSDGAYHSQNADDSDLITDFARKDEHNPFAAFFSQKFIPEVAHQLPKIVGISISGSFQLSAAMTLARCIKEFDRRICVVIGGAFFSTVPEVLLNDKTSRNLFSHVDAYVFFEGEIPFAHLIEQVFLGKELKSSQNVLVRGQPILNLNPLSIISPAEVGSPLISKSLLTKYFRAPAIAPVEVSRGCYWGKCMFCNLAAGANKRYRAIPVENVLKNIDILTFGGGTSQIIFSTLALAPKIGREIARHLIDSGRRISWSAWIRPESDLSDADIDLFHESGCTSLSITPESFHPGTLAKMKKGFDQEHVIRIIRHLYRKGLCGPINIIPGYPGERADDFLATVEVCRELELHGEFFPFYLLKNSPIYKNACQLGIVTHDLPEKDLAIAIPFEYLDSSLPSGIDLIRIAAIQYPQQIIAHNPLAGYTFDFRRIPSPSVGGQAPRPTLV